MYLFKTWFMLMVFSMADACWWYLQWLMRVASISNLVGGLLLYAAMHAFFISSASVYSPKFSSWCCSSQAYANSQNSATWCMLMLAIWWFQNLMVWSYACCFSPHSHALSTYLSTINSHTQSACLPKNLMLSTNNNHSVFNFSSQNSDCSLNFPSWSVPSILL